MLLHNIYESALLGLCALQWFCYLTVETSTKTQKKDTTFEKVITVSDSGLTAYWEKSLHHPWPKMSTLIEVDLTRIMMFSFFFFCDEHTIAQAQDQIHVRAPAHCTEYTLIID